MKISVLNRLITRIRRNPKKQKNLSKNAKICEIYWCKSIRPFYKNSFLSNGTIKFVRVSTSIEMYRVEISKYDVKKILKFFAAKYEIKFVHLFSEKYYEKDLSKIKSKSNFLYTIQLEMTRGFRKVPYF